MSSVATKTIEDNAPSHTPMMAQYHAQKEAHPDCLLFYRMGDFYELFFDDAVIASGVLDITLTRRGKNEGNEIPMCGVPFHSYEPYLAKLIRAGHKVAICEQTETPEEAKKRGGYKALVNREVVRVVTSGTLTEDNLLDSRANNYLAAMAEVGGQIGLAWLDLSTGEFNVQPAKSSNVQNSLQRIAASEIVVSDNFSTDQLGIFQSKLTILATAYFDSENARIRLQDMFGVGTLESFGAFSRAEVTAAGVLISYIERTQKGERPFISQPRQISFDDILEIDPSTLRNLEIIKTMQGERKGSLLSAIDRTVTGPGARLLCTRLSAPLRNIPEINQRHDEISDLIKHQDLRISIRDQLKSIADMERCLTRISINRGGPRDLTALRDGLKSALQIRADMIKANCNTGPLGIIANDLSSSPSLSSYADKLDIALTDSPPFLSRDGNFIRAGYSAKLDELKALRDESRRLIALLESRYKETTGIDVLKVTYNNVLGYFIEVPAKRADKLMISVANKDTDNPFIHRQTMSNAVRFTTAELAELERDISSAKDKALALEEEIFIELCADTRANAEEICRQAKALASLDVAASNAELAIDWNYTRPLITNDLDFKIEGGRHPVVEQALRKDSVAFIANDSDFAPSQKLWLLTGPNMAGKSTFLRQNAVIAILAQAGCYVPAKAATIGLVDKVFSRVGASDDLAKGQSTFMIEMVETASILNLATDKSLVILDEIGRGTATFDGLSIAWACLEYLHNINKCRGLFATHYHELTALKEKLKTLSCYTMEVKEWKGDVIFMHSVKPGTADRSYGIHVARIAGLPSAVIDRSTEVLNLLEKEGSSGKASKLTQELPLFSAQPKPLPQETEFDKKLKDLDPDSMSPKEALDTLYQLKKLFTDR
ncbi:MAG: DNA mismatch repair protein MutS [Micavibrio aeruginosavorus]|uniref:DNA mismatch repair protein MutS n=1 Tax=Micavibrio aeruginosavorus TaxID=349221 RepID=A0A2W5FK69_9BACT|nr:MAG: DNA mismatch repair protein MutS [Micavibrio aeruginosavorus]